MIKMNKVYKIFLIFVVILASFAMIVSSYSGTYSRTDTNEIWFDNGMTLFSGMMDYWPVILLFIVIVIIEIKYRLG